MQDYKNALVIINKFKNLAIGKDKFNGTNDSYDSEQAAYKV